MAVRVVEVENKVSRAKKTPYIWLQVKDETGELICMSFGQERIDEMNTFNGKAIEKDDIIILNGRKNKDVVFIDTVSIQENPVIVKKSDLKKAEPVAL